MVHIFKSQRNRELYRDLSREIVLLEIVILHVCTFTSINRLEVNGN